MIRVVVNASPVIGLSKIGKLNLLWELFDEVYISEEAMKYLGEKAYDPHFGARPLNRLIQNKILNPVASFNL